jgi:homoserine O-succinyltransferase
MAPLDAQTSSQDTVVSQPAPYATTGTEPIVIGLVNNMPDAEFWNTGRQFQELLSRSTRAPVRLRYFTLNEIPRSKAIAPSITEQCESVDRLWQSRLDGLIVTGIEPRAPNLRDEPFWPTLTRLIDWAQEHTVSTIWSCLAAHAAVLHLDGIERRPYKTKLLGIFESTRSAKWPFPVDLPDRWQAPHSRYNGLSESELVAAGYEILSQGPETGADIFAKRQGSLFLFLQGHLEYDRGALLREYRRDVGRFLNGRRSLYPEIPKSYFGTDAEAVFRAFRAQAEGEPSPNLVPLFPGWSEDDIACSWRYAARGFYAAWLGYISAARPTGQDAPRSAAQAIAPGYLRYIPASCPAPVPALFQDVEVRRQTDDYLTRQLESAHARLVNGPITPRIGLESFRADLEDFDFAKGRSLDAVLHWTIAAMATGNVQITHPRYLGLYNPRPTFPSQCADRISAAFNPQLASRTTSPVATAIESHVIRAVARRVGLPDGAGGTFTNAGAEANYTAVLCALTKACPAYATEGARAYCGAPTIYISKDSHLAWLKIAHQAGIGRSAARFIPTDGTGRMDADLLAAALERDRAEGCVPVFIGATAGTTGAGMIDPLVRCAEIARAEGLWYHVDAAWGGAALASDRLRPLFKGIELADSITVDAHKWFATTMGCGMFMVADPALLPSVFGTSATFMPPSQRPDLDPYVTSVQWSRRFAGLRLFLALAAAGWDGYAQHVERSVFLADKLARLLADKGWRIANEPALAVVCAEPPEGCAAARVTVERVVASGRAWVSTLNYEGRDVVRAAITHGETTPDDVEEVAKILHAAAQT